MAKNIKSKSNILAKPNDIKLDKINVFFKRSILKSIMKILTMEHSGFRTFKSMKNINRLFNHIDLSNYKDNQELESYVWCIKFISKQWIDGIVNIDLIWEAAKRSDEYDGVKEEVISSSIRDPNIITSPEAKMIFDLVGEALQYGFITSMKDQYTSLLDDINLNNPGAFREMVNRLFSISQSLMDIKYNTNLIANKVTFNTSDQESIREAMSQTISSLSVSNVLKIGIRRLNTLLSPGYMNGRVYVYLGLPASGKSLMLLKTAMDIRKYNTNFQTKTPGMKPCVLFITMENTFTETMERIWNMLFDDNLANYNEEEATEKISMELGKSWVEDRTQRDEKDILLNGKEEKQNIEIVIKYFPYRDISTDDLFTIIQDLREESMEVCALVFDYIKRIRPSVPIADNVKMELDRIMNELKAISVINDIPVITAHQMNRAAAVIVDGASKQGKSDVTKLVGREHAGSAWEIVEVADWAAVLNIEYKYGTDEKYMVVNVVKRRRIESGEGEFAKYTYLAHPFSRHRGLQLIDDMHLDKVLSLQSLATELDIVDKEKTNATPRLKLMGRQEFVEFDEE